MPLFLLRMLPLGNTPMKGDCAFEGKTGAEGHWAFLYIYRGKGARIEIDALGHLCSQALHTAPPSPGWHARRKEEDEASLLLLPIKYDWAIMRGKAHGTKHGGVSSLVP